MRNLASLAKLVLGVAAGGFLPAAACSATSPHEDAFTTACSDWETAYCNYLQRCLPTYLGYAFGDVPNCIAREAISCANSFSLPSVVFTAADLEACGKATENLACDAQQLPDECNIKPGRLADGAACGVGAQCQGKNCRFTQGSTCGVCAELSQQGGACTQDYDCDVALACIGGQCGPVTAPEMACTASAPCAQTLSVCPQSGICPALGNAGDACTIDQDCAQDLICGPMSHQCKAAQLVGLGEACGVTGDEQIVCRGPYGCVSTGSSGAGQCAAPVADGAGCDAASTFCQWPAQCIKGVCQTNAAATCL